MSQNHQFIVESGRWPRPIMHPRQLDCYRGKYLSTDKDFTAPPLTNGIRALQLNFEDRLRRAGAAFNPRVDESSPHTYRLDAPEEALPRLIPLLLWHAAARRFRHLGPWDGADESLPLGLLLQDAPQAPARRIVARCRLLDGVLVPCAEGDAASAGDAIALLMVDGREHRYGGQEYLEQLAGRPLEPGVDAILLRHGGSLLPWLHELAQRYEDDVVAFTSLRGSKVLFRASLAPHLHRQPHAVVAWRREPAECLPEELRDVFSRLDELKERMRYQCERSAMGHRLIPGCFCREPRRVRQLSLAELLEHWKSGEYPWVAQTYHDGPLLTYNLHYSDTTAFTARAWSLRHLCPISFASNS